MNDGTLPRPDWNEWRDMGAVNLRETILLSLDIDPFKPWGPQALRDAVRAAKTEPQNGDFAVLELRWSEFERQLDMRSRVALSHCSGRLTCVRNNPQQPLRDIKAEDVKVDLREFGDWARSIGWELPEQFPCTNCRREDRLSTRQMNTLLVIIAALCKRAGIDHSARGAAKAIMDATDELGAHVGDDTIRSILSKIPDAIERRS